MKCSKADITTPLQNWYTIFFCRRFVDDYWETLDSFHQTQIWLTQQFNSKNPLEVVASSSWPITITSNLDSEFEKQVKLMPMIKKLSNSSMKVHIFFAGNFDMTQSVEAIAVYMPPVVVSAV